MGALPLTHQDRPIRQVHRLCRAWASGSLPASHAGAHLRRGVQALCTGDQSLTGSAYRYLTPGGERLTPAPQAQDPLATEKLAPARRLEAADERATTLASGHPI